MTDTTDDKNGAHEILGELAKISPDTPIAPAHGIAAIAMTMALKFHDINTVQDGTLYQQYKLEGRNMRSLHLDVVFETAMRIEAHLLASSERIAGMVIDAVMHGAEDGDEGGAEEGAEPSAPPEPNNA